jgi:hypothetical protein
MVATTMTDEQIRDLFAPFFQATRAGSDNPRGNYACVFCADAVPNNTVAAVSFAGAVKRWAHVDCLRHIAGSNLLTDSKAKKKAQLAQQERRTTERKAGRSQETTTATLPAGHVCPTVPASTALAVQVEALREEIEKEYEDDIDTAIDLIQKQTAKIAELEDLLRLSKADYGVMYEKATTLERQLSQIMADSVAQPTTTPDSSEQTTEPESVTTTSKKRARNLTPEQQAQRKALLAKAS